MSLRRTLEGSPSTRARHRTSGLWKKVAAAALASAGLAFGGAATAAAAAPGPAPQPPTTAFSCGRPGADRVACTAVQLLSPAQNWHPGPAKAGPGKHGPGGGSGGGAVPPPPGNGYYPGDLQSAYGLTSAAASFAPGPDAPTVAVVDAYNDPTAATDLAAYRASLSGATDTNTGLADGAIPPLCTTSPAPCVTFTKVDQSGSSNYPRPTAGWSQEISVDLDMVSAICPACNIVLVEASSNSLTNLAAAVAYAKSLHPAAVANSYGAGEARSELTYNAVYSATTGTAVTAATGDSGYGAEFPAASPGVTAVGGTSLTYSGSGSGLVWDPRTVWSKAGAGCSKYEAMPAWQAVTGVYSLAADCTGRQIGDVAAVANPSTGVAVYDTYHGTGWMVFGGTSVATQIIGATYGLAAGAGTLQPSPAALYPDGTAATGPTPGLVPVTSGHDASCGTYLCNATDRLSSGYNGPTGLGTPDGVGAFQATTPTAGSLSFTPPSATLVAGATAGPFVVGLSTGAPSGGLSVTLTTSSSQGGFSGSASGTFSSSLSVPVAGTATQSQPFYYRDTTAGSPAVTATASGWGSASLSVTVSPGPLTTVAVAPTPASVASGGTQSFTASGADRYGNPVAVDPTWSVTPGLGTFTPPSGPSTTFSASGTAGTGTVTATTGAVAGTAALAVTNLSEMTVTVTVGTVSKRGPKYHVPLTVAATSSGSPVATAGVLLQVFSGSTCSGTPVASGTTTTGKNGQASITFQTRTAGSWCALATVSEPGYATGSGQAGFST